MELQKFIIDPTYFEELGLHSWPEVNRRIHASKEEINRNDPDIQKLIEEVKEVTRLDLDIISEPSTITFIVTNAVCLTMMGAEAHRKGYLTDVR
jgi:hypothetical protein